MTRPSTHDAFTIIGDLSAHQPIPEDGILTRTVHDDAVLKAVLFTFSRGQELSEHTATMPAVLHFLEGEADLSLGETKSTVGPGTWVHMPPRLKHSIRTKSPVRMMLYLLKGGAEQAHSAEGCA